MQKIKHYFKHDGRDLYRARNGRLACYICHRRREEKRKLLAERRTYLWLLVEINEPRAARKLAKLWRMKHDPA